MQVLSRERAARRNFLLAAVTLGRLYQESRRYAEEKQGRQGMDLKLHTRANQLLRENTKAQHNAAELHFENFRTRSRGLLPLAGKGRFVVLAKLGRG